MAENANFDEALQRARQLAAKFANETPNFNSTGGIKRHSDEPVDSTTQKRVNVIDKLAQASEAAAYLNTKIGVSQNPGFASQPGTLTVEHKIPDNFVGLIIGKKGEQISKIQSDSGCVVQIAPDSNGQPDRVVTLTGTNDQIEQVKRVFDDLISRAKGSPMNFVQGFHPQGSYSIEISVPGPKAGLLIGKNGETIKALQEQTGVKMIIIQENNSATETDKPLRITGDPAKVEIAKQKVIEILNSRVTPSFLTSTKPATTFAVPNEKAGLVIGKGGETIKEIIRLSGAYVEIQKQPPPNPTIKIFNVSGDQNQIDSAIRLICERANIPLPEAYAASQTSYYGANQYGQAWNGQAALYGQQQQQVPSAAASSMPAPSINPQTGQPDYTAAWVEYYRRQGMHQQADAILAQSRQSQTTVTPQVQNAPATNGAAAVQGYDYTQWQYNQQWQQWQQQQQYSAAGAGIVAAPAAQQQWSAPQSTPGAR